jgi:DNA-directed RNA polymerase specialized sigma24 family protein
MIEENIRFEFSEDEYKLLCKKAMLNDELATIFLMKIQGCSIVEISMKVNLSERTVNRRINQLKRKIKRVL